MDTPTVLLVDLTHNGSEAELANVIERRFKLVRISWKTDLERMLVTLAPVALCFEYDYPDLQRLAALTRAKREFPSYPILMVTEQHSEALAVWALRARVWNYFVKPVAADLLLESLGMLLRAALAKHRDRHMLLPPQPLPDEARVRDRTDIHSRAIRKALKYIDDHLRDRLVLKTVAENCGTSDFQLSRIFKREVGTTFQDYLLRKRIERAAELLGHPNVSISDVSWSVGFHDASYFTRIFRRYTGFSPSEYRDKSAVKMNTNQNASENIRLQLSLSARSSKPESETS